LIYQEKGEDTFLRLLIQTLLLSRMYLDDAHHLCFLKQRKFNWSIPNKKKKVNYNVPSELKAGFFSKGIKQLSGNKLDFSMSD